MATRLFLRDGLIAALIGLIAIALFFSPAGPSASQKQTSNAAPSEPVTTSFFGLTINHWPSVPWPAVPFGSLRTWDTGVIWSNINRQPGVYDWSNFERLVQLAESHGVDVLFTFGQTPRWASSKPDAPTEYGPGFCAPPSKLEYWDDFVRATVTQARGRIKLWEIWNEPQDESFYCGDIATMVELQKRAYKIIKTLDPTALVLTPSPVGGEGPKWMSEFLAAGGGQYADILAFHGYWGINAEKIVGLIKRYKDVFAAKGEQSKPIWDTEASWGENAQLPNPDAQAAFLAKFYLLHWSGGVTRLYWYSYDNRLFGGLWDKTEGLHKAAVAYQQLHKWILGARLDKPCQVLSGVWTCELSRPNGYQAIIVWQSSGPNTFSAPSQYKQYRDLDGNVSQITNMVPIGDKPILLETNAEF